MSGRSGRRIRGGGVTGAFTLIELLVVVAIIALLLAILLPSLANARRRSRRTVCLSRMHQFSIGLTAYQAENVGYYPTPLSPQHWPMGWSCNYIGDNPFCDDYVPAGPALLFKNDYILDPEYFFCPSCTIENLYGYSYDWLKITWDEYNWQPDGWHYPFMGYCYWAGYRHYRDAPLNPDPNYDKERVANPRFPEPDQVVWTDIITRDNGMPPHSPGVGWELTNHVNRAQQPEGGNELLVDGSAVWHDFDVEKTKRRLRLIWQDIHFVGPSRPGDEDL